jgi:hypothetical protein
MTLMLDVLERLLGRGASETEAESEYSPHTLDPDFDAEEAREVRRMEDHYIHLGLMTEDERMAIPPEFESPQPHSI